MNDTQEFLIALAIIFALFMIVMTVLITLVIESSNDTQTKLQPMTGQTKIITPQIIDDIKWCLTHD